MILRPLDPVWSPGAENKVPISGWSAIEKIQKEKREAGWLITQPAHAALAGELARHMHWPFPAKNSSENKAAGANGTIQETAPEVVRAISLHDSGWGPLDAAVVRKLQAGFDGAGLAQNRPQTTPQKSTAQRLPERSAAASLMPISFVSMPPADVLSAWIASIEIAEASSPLAGYMVSRHFSRLTEIVLAETKPAAGISGSPSPQTSSERMQQQFLSRELSRQGRLAASSGRSGEELETLVDQLQFCDVLSLYLCSGATENVILPRRRAADSAATQNEDVHLFRHATGCKLQPSPFATEEVFTVAGLRFPRPAEPSSQPTSAIFEIAVG